MFLLGHSCWSYLFSKLTGRQVKANVPAYLALLSGILPDFDIYFRPLIQHHTYTHSLLVIIPTVIVLTYFFGRFGLAFSAGILSHLVADSMVGSIPLFYPLFPSLDIGLNLGIPSLADSLLEIGSLIIVIIYALKNGDPNLVFKPQRESLLLAIPLVAIVTLTLLFVGDNNIPLTTFAFSRRALTLITIGHIVLAGILSLGSVQGLRWFFKSRKAPHSPQSTVTPTVRTLPG